jgi:outer membrane lipopolysaccharide assembly protein LptE/RlpB
MARLLSALFAGCLLLFTSACSHYRLGTGVERDFQSIFIAPVQTNAAYPQAAAVLTTQIRETFIRDGRVRVVNTPDEADAVLSVKLSSLQRAKLTSLTSDSGLARKMGLTLSATTTLQDPAGKKTWFTNRAVAVERQLFTDNGSADLQAIQQLQAEYALLPQLAQPFAQEILGSVLDTW